MKRIKKISFLKFPKCRDHRKDIRGVIGIKGLDDNHLFTRDNLSDLDTVNNINEMYDELVRYYIPCKLKNLTDLNEKKMYYCFKTILKDAKLYTNVKRKICRR